MNQASSTLAREKMLQSQILTGHVLQPRILAALMTVARERFVPEAVAGAAYVDEEIPLGNQRFLMEPLTFARLLAHANIESHETVLDVGTATGYSAAVLSHLARKVVALEEDAALFLRAKSLLGTRPNVECEQGALILGSPRSAPYDVILIEGAIEVLPPVLADQLREGGRLIAVHHDAAAKTALSGPGKLVEYKKVRGALCTVVLRDAAVPLLSAFRKPTVFAL